MGISERREREKNERRKAILSCARELILLQGVDRVSMDDIARQAELSKATVYLYFPGKEVLFNEICEEAAKKFFERFKPLLENGLCGLKTLKYFWRNYVEMFGNFDEMIIIFKVRKFLYPGSSIFTLESENKSPYVDAILEAIRTVIEQCKLEGIFDPELDSSMARSLLLSTFASFVENSSKIPKEARESRAFIAEMTAVFQLLIRGFAKEGVDRNLLNIDPFSTTED
ncbi:MAG: TetR/AcrR family transcriptional regulator [Spirochaetes bacterium]|nr:TetR/AcrR family transcriptional regulator [Spirochaetota bacterium]